MKYLKKLLKSIKKYNNFNKNNDFSEKNYIKTLILKEIETKKSIDPSELSMRFVTSKELVEEIIKEINLEKKEIEKIEKKKIKPKEKKIKKLKWLNNVLDKEDKRTLRDLFFKIILFGIPLNFAIFIVSKGFFTFNFYTWIGWGITLWLIKKEISPILRGIIHK